jgi:thiol:disulfide interchange protein DsbA
MNRRDFALGLGATALLAQSARAATEPVEGKDYTKLGTPVPVAVAGKIEVIEFFGYWCPHCSQLEPVLEPWVKKLPSDVNFRRIPVAWQAQHVPFQKLYFALEAMGAGGEVHRKVFDAVHVQRLRIDNDGAIGGFAGVIGVDKARLLDEMKGFTVASKLNVANKSFASFQINGVPTLAVNGRFLTSPEMAGGEEQALRVAEALIRKARTTR